MIRSYLSLSLATALGAGLCLAPVANAQEFTARLGYHSVNPKSDNGTLAGLRADVDSDQSFTGGVSWFFHENFSTDLWAGLSKFKHEVSLDGAGVVAEVEHRPIALGVNYHFGSQAFRPFVGLGYNWVRVSPRRGVGILEGTTISTSNASGLTYVFGADIALGESAFLRADARRLDFDTDVAVAELGGGVGTANVDPWVYGVSAGFRF